MRAPKSQGPRPEKSYFDWKVKSVKPPKTPRVINLVAICQISADIYLLTHSQGLNNYGIIIECHHNTQSK